MFCRMKEKVLDGKFQWILEQNQVFHTKEKCLVTIEDDTISTKGVMIFYNPLFKVFENNLYKG